MEEEHKERKMIEWALAGIIKREEDHTWSKIGRMRYADQGRMGIELPPLNIALAEVHRELATMQNGAKDMVLKNKSAKKAEKYAKEQLEEGQKIVVELEHWLQEAITSNTTTATRTPKLQEEVEAQRTILAKAKKAVEIANMEIESLRSEL